MSGRPTLQRERSARTEAPTYSGGGVDTDDGRTLFGFDAETYLKMKSKEDPEWERTVGQWINLVIAPTQIEDIGDLYTSLKDGLVLCQLMNKLRPGTIPKWSTKRDKNGNLHPLMERENINLYLEACWKVGINADDMFLVPDLHSRRGMQSVLTNLAALSNLAPIWGCSIPGVGIRTRPLDIGDGSSGKKKDFKWQVNTQSGPIYTQEAVDGDEVEQMENEINFFKQQVEEAQRTVSKLDASKNYLAEQLRIERKKLQDSEKEIAYMKSSGTSGGGPPGPAQSQFIDELKKSRDELQKELSTLKRQIGSGLNLASLRKELEETRNQKNELEAKLSGVGDIVQIDKLRNRIKQLTAENLSFMNQAMAASGKDAGAYIKKLETLEEEKTTLVADYEKKIQELNVKIAAVEDECFKTMCEFEEEQEQEFDKQSALRAEAEEALRSVKQKNTEEFARHQAEIEDLKIEKDVLTHEYTTQKNALELQLNELKSQIKSKSDETTKEINKLKKLKDQLVQEQQARKIELETTLESTKKKYDQQLSDYRLQIEKLAKEKAALAEKSFADTRKITQELFQITTQLQITQRKLAKESPNASAAKAPTNDLLELQRAQITSTHNYEKEKLLQEKDQAIDTVERALLEEKRRADTLQLEMEQLKEKLTAQFDAEVSRSEKELEELLAEVEEMERQLTEAKEQSAVPLKELQDKFSSLTSSFLKEKIQLENKIRELDQTNINDQTERDLLQKRLKTELEALQNKIIADTQKYKEKIEQMEKTSKALLEEQEQANQKQAKVGTQAKLLEEMTAMRTTLDTALHLLQGVSPSGMTIDNYCTPNLMETKLKMLEAQLQAQQKEADKNKQLMAHQSKMLEGVEAQLKDLRSKHGTVVQAAAPAAAAAAVPILPADKSALTPEKAAARKAAQERLARQNNRKSILVYLEKNTVEQDMQKLTECIEALMLGEAASPDASTAFKGLFKLDNGRRLLCFSLHESSQGCEPGEPFLMSLGSFEILKFMIQDVMNNLNLSDGSDQISGRLLLECSSLIGRESRKGKEPELLQSVIKPHRVWLNTYFWEEYFWTQVTPKFEELNIESKQDENAFFKVEIVEFAKGMLGWGNLGIYAISLFVESLADKCDLDETTKNALVKEVETYCQQRTTGKKEEKKISIAPQTHRRTMALSHAQIQEALQSQGASDGGATWDTGSEEIKAAAERQWPRSGAKPSTGAPARPSNNPTRERERDRGSRNPNATPSLAQRPSKGPAPGAAPPSPSKTLSTTAAKKGDDFQLSRRKQAAKTVQLSSAGFLANLSMANNSSAFL